MLTNIATATVNRRVVANITHEIHDVSPRPVRYGGFSDIYKAVWRSVKGEVKVAIKVIRTASGSSAMPVALRHEISVWKRISHPNIHELCGVCEGFEPAPALVSPWYDNGDINNYVRRCAADPDLELVKLRLFAGVAIGLKFLHELGIVHGDIKGGNVLISDDGVPRLCDFGLSRLLLEHSQSTPSTTGKGTVRWMAPELLLVEGARHSYESDVWACGCLFIEVWSSVRPYHTMANDQQVFLALSQSRRPDRPPDIADMVWNIVEECCNFNVVERPALSQVIACIHHAIIMQRVQPMVMCGRPVDSITSSILRDIKSSLETVDSYLLSRLEALSDAELATTILRLLAIFSLSPAGGSFLFDDSLFKWCLAKFGTGSLLLPAGVTIPNTNFDDIFDHLDRLYEPEKVRPLARLVERGHPDLAKQFMTQFATRAIGQPVRLNTDLFSVAWLPGSMRVVAGCRDGNVRILDVATRGTLLHLAGHTSDVNQVAVSPDGRLLASCSDDHSIKLWEAQWHAQTGTAIGSRLVNHSYITTTGSVLSVAFSPDGRYIASGSRDDTIRVWSIEACTIVLGPLRGHTKDVFSVAYSPDGSHIASGSRDRTVRVWDARTGDLILTLHGHADSVRSVAYSPDGSRIASGSNDRTIRIWDASTGQQVGSPLEGHFFYIWCVAYSPDGTRIVSASRDCTIRIWDAVNGACIATIRGHTATVWSVAFSPDGRRLASASDDGTVRIWDATNDWRRWDI